MVPKVVDIEARRAQFVDASLDVIAGEGLSAATMRRIAAQAGVTTGAITRYFSSREALLLEAVRAAHYAAGHRMQGAARPEATAMERLKAVVLEALPLDALRMREWRVWLSFRSELPGRSSLWAANEAGYANWRRYLQALLEPICVDPKRVEREASLLIALVDGIGLRLAAMTVSADQLDAEQRKVTEDVYSYLEVISLPR